MTELLIAVISYKNYQYTQETIDALLRQTVPVDIVVWDNNSPDGSGPKLSERYQRCANVRVHMSPENVLWSPAINEVLQRYPKAHHRYLGFMNNDIMLPPRSIERMLVTLRQPNVGLVGPMGARIGGPQDWAANIGTSFRSEESISGLPPKRVTYIIGACAFLPLKVWYQVGPLDKDMPLGADDHDYSIRIKRAGYEIWVNQNVYATHIGHASGDSPEWDVWNQKGWDVFNSKWSDMYRTQAEALLCHWQGTHVPGWEIGTGWLNAEDEEAKSIYAIRRHLHEQNLQLPNYRNVFESDHCEAGF